jgi:predicted TIM-barrel fold metal-dependent hydrolase
VEVFPVRGQKTNFQALVEAAGVDRIVFGSCLPFQYAEPQMVRLNQMGLKDEDMEKILYKNLQTLLTEKK